MAPITSFIRWAGGKSWLVPYVKKLTEGLDYNNYFEPFMGGASIFFSLDNPHQSYLSDVNNELVNTFCSVRDKPETVISYGKKNILQKSGTFDCGNNQDTCDLFYPFMEKCLLYIRDKSLSEWDKGDRDNGMLPINRGIQAVIRVVNDIVNMLVERGSISPKTQDINDMFSLIEYYLKPLTDYLNLLTPEHRKNLRGYFGGGADTRFWRAYQKAIADSRPDFNPEGLNEYWQNESKEYNDDTRTMLKELELRIKMVISSKLEEHYGESWLIKGLPKAIYTYAKNEADEAIYESVANDGDEVDIPIWNYVLLSDCKQIIINGKNWSLLFEDTFVRPEEEKILGGKEAKTEWIIRLNTIKNKLQNDKYSVPLDEYSFVKNVYDWFMDVLV